MNRQLHDEIRAWMDEGQYISARWLATTLLLNISEARTVMLEFLELNKDINASYCISGCRTDKTGISFAITTDEKMEETKTKFSSISNVSIYSLQKHKSDSIESQLQAADSAQTDEMLSKSSNCDHFLLNGIGNIRLSTVSCLPAGKRAISPRSIIPRPTETTSDQISSLFAPKVATKTSSSSTSSKSTAVPVVSSAVRNFFGSSQMNKEKKAEVSNESNDSLEHVKLNAKEESESKNSLCSNVDKKSVKSKEPKNKLVVDDDDDEEWDDGTGGYRTDKSLLKQRIVDEENKQRKTFSIKDDDDDDENLPEATVSEATTVDEVFATINTNGDLSAETLKLNSKGRHVHGAMDDYFEDVAIAAEIAKRENPLGEGGGDDDTMTKGEGASSCLGKRKKKRLVEKMFANEKGYLVTENVWEEVTDDEAEVTSANGSGGGSGGGGNSSSSRNGAASAGRDTDEDQSVSTAKKPSASAPPLKKVAAAPKKGGAGAGPAGSTSVAQKSMTSFFTKK